MDTLLLSVQASGRDAPLTEVLGEQYDLVNSALSLAARDQIPQADLLIVDHATFLEVGSEAIEAFRDREPRIASPVLLLVPRPRLAGLDPEIWEHVDDVLGTPVRPPELKGRVRSLLRLRRSTEKIEEERERLATAQRIAGLGSWHRDFETDELHWSAETRRLFGWAPDEAVTVEKFMNAVHPDDREALRRQQKQLFEEGSPVDVEYRVVRPDGEERILHERGEAEFADDGTLLRASGTVLDVTDQRDRERELRVLSEAVEQAGEAVLITEGAPLDEPGPAIVYANSAFEEMSGYDEEEVLGRTPRMLQGPDTDREVLDSLREALEAGRSWKGETVNYHKDGHPYRVRWNVAPVSNSEGEIDYWVSVQRDVTEEWEREEALRRQRNLLEQTQRLAGAWETDLRTGTTTWSEEVYQIHELPLEAEPGLEESFEFYPSEVQSQLRAAFERCIEEGERYDLELPLITAKGNHRWVRTVGGPVEKEDGSVVKVAGAIQDITDRKEAERTLREERDRFATLFHNLPTPVVYGHPDDQSRLRVQAVNKAFESVFGYEQAEIRGADIQSLIVPDGETADADTIRRRLLAGEPVDRTVQRKAADGLRDFRVQVTLREGQSGPTEGYAIYTDVTDERRRRTRQRRQQKALLELTTDERVVSGDFQAALRAITERAAEVLDVARVNVWLVDEEGRWYCEDHFDRVSGEHDSGRAVPCEQYPSYIEALAEHRVLGANDAHSDPRTAALSEDYYRPRNIAAVLDATLHSEGEVVGVVCCEHVGDVREWAPDEHQFAGEVSDIVLRALHNQKRAARERELRQKERRYQAVFEDPNILVGLLDPDGTTLDINQTAMAYVEAELETLRGRPFWETPWFTGGEAIQDQLRQGIDQAAEGEYVEFELDLSTSLAEPLIVSGSFRPVTNEEGEVTSLLVSARDVTERMQSRRQLERYSEYTERLLNSSDDLFFVTDEEGDLQRWNERVTAVTGYTNEEIGTMEVFDFVPAVERDEAAAALAKVFEKGRAQLDTLLQKKDGTTTPYEFAANAVEHPDGDMRLIGIGRDITERKERERALLAAKREAEDASRLKSAMLANMSHEIRTPLTSVIGFTEILGEGLEGEMSLFAEKAHQSAQRLMKTLDSVLELSKLEAGVYELERESVRLDEVVKTTVELFRQEARKKGLALETDLPEKPTEDFWNEGVLNRILENLLENAIKFTPEGGEVVVRVRANSETAFLEVEDTGVGISATVRSKIFKAFRQESQGLAREYEGSGLGLSIVERLTDALGGEIHVESEKGTGTCFTVALPRRREARS